jgi:hypothetical protein
MPTGPDRALDEATPQPATAQATHSPLRDDANDASSATPASARHSLEMLNSALRVHSQRCSALGPSVCKRACARNCLARRNKPGPAMASPPWGQCHGRSAKWVGVSGAVRGRCGRIQRTNGLERPIAHAEREHAQPNALSADGAKVRQTSVQGSRLRETVETPSHELTVPCTSLEKGLESVNNLEKGLESVLSLENGLASMVSGKKLVK